MSPTVGFGGADDGEAGEGDDIQATIEAVHGGDGDDAVKARDDVAETVACGADADLAEVDATDLQSDCEATGAPAGDRDGDGFGDGLDCAPDDGLRPAKDGIDTNCDGMFDLIEQPGAFALATSSEG